STRDLLNILDDIAKRGAGFRSLHDAWADTTSAHGRLMVTVLAGLAEFERELILARTSDGRARAKARGVRFGRPAALTPHQRAEALQRLGNGEAQADVARSFNVSQATISRLRGSLIQAHQSSFLLYRKPLSAITNRLKPRNKRVVRLYRSLNAIIVGLAKANGLHQLTSNILH